MHLQVCSYADESLPLQASRAIRSGWHTPAMLPPPPNSLPLIQGAPSLPPPSPPAPKMLPSAANSGAPKLSAPSSPCCLLTSDAAAETPVPGALLLGCSCVPEICVLLSPPPTTAPQPSPCLPLLPAGALPVPAPGPPPIPVPVPAPPIVTLPMPPCSSRVRRAAFRFHVDDVCNT